MVSLHTDLKENVIFIYLQQLPSKSAKSGQIISQWWTLKQKEKIVRQKIADIILLNLISVVKNNMFLLENCLREVLCNQVHISLIKYEVYIQICV